MSFNEAAALRTLALRAHRRRTEAEAELVRLRSQMAELAATRDRLRQDEAALTRSRDLLLAKQEVEP